MTTARSSRRKLPNWYQDLTAPRLVSGKPSEAASVCHDNRAVVAGSLFVAIAGATYDGNSFIPDAISRGARSVIVQEDQEERWARHLKDGVAFVAVADIRAALAEAAAGFHGHPARALGVIGVTGTDGKTTTVHLIAHILNATARRAGYLSSVEFGVGGMVELNASHMTTLEAPDVQRELARIRDAGGRYAVVEASSIGLDMHRVDCCEFDVGVFTNLSRDHLDYHGNMAAYRDAKAILFRMLGESADKGLAKAAIMNADDPASEEIHPEAPVPVISYATKAKANVTAHAIKRDGFGTKFKVRMFGEDIAVRTGLLGEHNVANCLAAVAAAVSQGVEFGEAVQALASFPGVPGRMELIDEGQPFRVVVDIASTEPAMENVLSMLKPLTAGRLIVVFGAAGERDHARRRGIARAVAKVADAAVITNEDPRGEIPDMILDDIEAALKAANFRRYERELDRRIALEMAFRQARSGDTVLLAGKGTEQSIVIGGTHWPWDERRIARELLEDLRGR
ncbi:MAG: UDP-N-acetylmuramoyl-L-alanyl-D-glutamate--2,6-diaminopimelate ligase [Dehalococcoidia bacterium]